MKLRNNNYFLSLICALLISNFVIAQQQPDILWEYKTVSIPLDTRWNAFIGAGVVQTTNSMLNEEKFDVTLNKLAADGWQLVTATSIVTWGTGATTNIIAIFKRPKIAA